MRPDKGGRPAAGATPRMASGCECNEQRTERRVAIYLPEERGHDSIG